MKKKLSLISTIIFFVALIPTMAFSQELIGIYELDVATFFEDIYASMGMSIDDLSEDDLEEMGYYDFYMYLYLYDNDTFEVYSYDAYGEDDVNFGYVEWVDEYTIIFSDDYDETLVGTFSDDREYIVVDSEYYSMLFYILSDY